MAVGGLAAGGFDGLANGEEFLRNDFCNAVFAGDDGVLQPFGERAGDTFAERRDEMNPIGAEERSEDRKRNDDAAREMQLFRHDVHDFAIAEDFGAADVEDACGGFGLFEDAG